MPLGTLGIIIGYLLGSIPTAYIVGRLRKGVDIRDIGSRNMGAANVMREIGIHEGILVALIDIAKGASAILIAQTLDISGLWVIGAGFAAVVGHNFPVFAGFRGGRGTATIIGIFLVLAFQSTLVTLVIVAIPFFVTLRFSAAILIGVALGFVGFALLPLFIWLLEGSVMLVCYVLTIDIFMLVRNLSRIRQLPAKGIVRDMIYHGRRKKVK
jgi:acyl phosphate:glycerol-3-phosphate acyltransferase